MFFVVQTEFPYLSGILGIQCHLDTVTIIYQRNVSPTSHLPSALFSFIQQIDLRSSLVPATALVLASFWPQIDSVTGVFGLNCTVLKFYTDGAQHSFASESRNWQKYMLMQYVANLLYISPNTLSKLSAASSLQNMGLLISWIS